MTNESCFECADGKYKRVVRDFVTEHPYIGPIRIKDVPQLVCDKCGDVVIDHKGIEVINEFLRFTFPDKD